VWHSGLRVGRPALLAVGYTWGVPALVRGSVHRVGGEHGTLRRSLLRVSDRAQSDKIATLHAWLFTSTQKLPLEAEPPVDYTKTVGLIDVYLSDLDALVAWLEKQGATVVINVGKVPKERKDMLWTTIDSVKDIANVDPDRRQCVALFTREPRASFLLDPVVAFGTCEVDDAPARLLVDGFTVITGDWRRKIRWSTVWRSFDGQTQLISILSLLVATGLIVVPQSIMRHSDTISGSLALWLSFSVALGCAIYMIWFQEIWQHQRERLEKSGSGARIIPEERGYRLQRRRSERLAWMLAVIGIVAGLVVSVGFFLAART
jgi:hypothetical protein